MDWWDGFSQCALPSANCIVNWSAWATVASVGIGVLAWVTSRTAVKIARQQYVAALQLREDTARILVRLLMNEVSSLPARVAMTIRYLNGSVWWANEYRPVSVIVKGQAFKALIAECQMPMLPIAEQVQERIHNLPKHFGEDLASIVGMSRTLNDSARRVSERLAPIAPMPGNFADEMAYNGNTQDFEILSDNLALLFEMSKQYANEFRALANIELIDFSTDMFRTDTQAVATQPT
ncbi:hypothetical protein CFBP498_26260 [Xanthomonas hortorum pv. vitians]|uniref:Uncharacterized protein n=2 Tax=Xanthomonas hortorum TaxID=56454 RepID=A0A6V7DQU5_9XANT|nr:hypothetical protein [Xanthomonas hortorum]MCE4302378.1 hypothetical protein [Xanthomonas hortorum pv. vitians]MDT7826209.1 hypothetical protein [Xanthomonas hortorum pv. vitians]MDV7248624.1 hypothetical protein [Xanthomonas hortorum pv. vitians]NMI32476.1 hypothetical protein [Xanthomonas hortorum pv. vitians]CAD0338903.1 hypothetical protein CFBP498_26260 [Xanthomonas hortorum pv. vitians]